MHQPYYGHKDSQRYSLPWVRLHGIKDYYPMALICEEFPALHQNFNFTPCLLKQIEDYNHGATDLFEDLALKPASVLDDKDKDYILFNFFLTNWERMVRKFPRYEDLLCKRGKYVTRADQARERFSTQDFLDLQVLFNLSWFHSLTLENDEELKKLKEKGEDYREEDKKVILRKEKKILSSIIPMYKGLQSKGQIEISTSPYYHPILPLLCDTEAAKVAMPDLKLDFRFSHPEDAQVQVERAISYHRSLFGSPPHGIWPSEGSVSEDIIPIVARAGIRWIATDEEILSLSVERKQPARPYEPYLTKVKGHEICLLFRDRNLSDRIGFTYQRWSPQEAAKDLVSYLRGIRKEVADSGDDHLVTIILDGENPWEYYPDNGREFLFTLFAELSQADDLKTVTINQYLKNNPPRKTLTRVFPGSWINHNFYIWIGHQQDQIAWDLLCRTREDLVKCQTAGKYAEDKLTSAWEEIYIAEGSDWCWWYGTDHSSALDEEFDSLYREHLANVYRILGKKIPEELLSPITGKGLVRVGEEPAGLIHPVIDGQVSHYYEWRLAGLYQAGRVGGTMHRSYSLIERIYYGFDLDNVYLRLDHQDIEKLGDVRFKIEISSSRKLKKLMLELKSALVAGEERMTVRSLSEEGKWAEEKTKAKCAFGQIIEIALPFSEIGAREGDEVSFFVAAWTQEKEAERWPEKGRIAFLVPGPDYESRQWYV